MVDNSIKEEKVIAAFKGVINSYKLEPILTKRESLEPEYEASWRTFSNEKNEGFELYYRVKPHSRVLELVERLYPGKTDYKLVSRLLLDAVTEWITAEKDPTDQRQLEQAGYEFLSNIKSAIKPRLLFLPLEGLDFLSNKSLSVGNCELFNNHENSKFMQIIQQDTKRYSNESIRNNDWSEQVNSYLTCEITAHTNRAIQRSVKEADLALNILRLYVSSYYFHEHRRNMVRRMGLSGSLHLDARLRIFFIDPDQPVEDDYFPGKHDSRTIHRNLEISSEFMTYMKEHGLNRINLLLQSLGLNYEGDDIARRLMRTISWFGKATSARSAADSFLMYAIAIEGLLSEDRTPQETYATQMAALITCDDNDCLIFPVGGYLSSEFAKQLKNASSLNDRYNIVRKKILQLFSYRNRIAHGAILDDEIEDSSLLDFETIVQNSILSFVEREWDSLSEFKKWINKHVRYDFMLTQ